MAYFISPAIHAKRILVFIGNEVAKQDGKPISMLPSNFWEAIRAPEDHYTNALITRLHERGQIEMIVEALPNGEPRFSMVTLSLAGWEQYEEREGPAFSDSFSVVDR